VEHSQVTDLRKLARGQPCLVRIPGVCDGGGETTVLAHLRIRGNAGIGQKPVDMPFGAFCCFACHEVCDGRRKPPEGMTRTDVQFAHALGCLFTVRELDKLGEL
jgi:hypothetical protein